MDVSSFILFLLCPMRENIDSYKQLRVFKESFNLALEIFQRTKSFPAEEKYSLTDQIRRSSRSVCLNLGEAWRKRRYPKSFISKLSDSEAEACETQISLLFANECGYMSAEIAAAFEKRYENVIGMIVNMINNPDQWKI
jgi:four helix bundle protein